MSTEIRPKPCRRLPVGDQEIVEAALRILERRMPYRTGCLTTPAAMRDFLRLKLAGLEYEAFWCVFLDAQNRVISMTEMFRGTLTQTSVYPREIVKAALACNAAVLVIAHNHPSGQPEPSIQDQSLTRTLVEALALVDVKILDHFIVGGGGGVAVSFAERGLL